MAAPGSAIYIKDGVIQLMNDRDGSYGMWILPCRGIEHTRRWVNSFRYKADLSNRTPYAADSALLFNEDLKEAVFSPSMSYFGLSFDTERIWDVDSSVTSHIFKHRWKEIVQLNWPGWRIKVADKTHFLEYEFIEIDFDIIPELRQPTPSEESDFILSKHDTYIYILRGLLFPLDFKNFFEISGTAEARIVKYKPEAISTIDKNRRVQAKREAENAEYILGLLLQ
jgi:hypothetical protein